MNIEKVDYKYQLKSDVKQFTDITGYCVISDWFTLSQTGELTLKKGYCWNGATGAFDTHDFLIPSAVHDALYQMIKLKLLPESTRLKADQLLRKMCKKRGMSAFRAQYVYLAVRIFGSKFAR